ncbi:MAG: hypothetical protein EXR08_11580 [Alphaproteobacteria bacterium]|nr:hypothetical protein [Alphaproteobacteria bacterium]
MRTWVDGLLSPAARADPAVRQAHVELLMSLAAPFLFLPVAAASTLYFKSDLDLFDLVWFSAWFLIPVSQWLVVRRTGNVTLTRDLLSLSLLLFIGVGAAYSGGLASSMVIGLCVLPIENMLSGDRKRVLMSIAAVIGTLAVLWGLRELKWLPADRATGELHDMLRPLAVIFVMLYSYLVADALIRHRRERGKSLQDTENQFESLFETAPISMMEQDWSQTRTMINTLIASGVRDLNRHLVEHPEGLQALVGAIRMNRINKATLALYRALNKEDLAAHLAPARLSEEEWRNYRMWIVSFASGESGTYLNETVSRRKQGGQVHTRVISAVVPEHRHDWKRVVTTISDVSDRKRAEIELYSAKEEADRSNRAKSQFLATMSHELRTPLNAIIGFSDIMRKELFGPFGELRYRDYAEDIYDSGLHLLHLINDMLDLSRIEAGKYEMREESLSAADLFDWVLNMTEPQVITSGVVLHQSIQENLPAFFADLRAMRQIMLNLLSNAVKFTPRGNRIEMSAFQDGGTGEIVLQVADSGRGIPARLLNKITEPFVQAGDPTITRETGTGLGLSITKSLVSMHAGKLLLTSTEHQGTKASVRLPASRAAFDQMPEASEKMVNTLWA